jgi:hypothetical protein
MDMVAHVAYACQITLDLVVKLDAQFKIHVHLVRAQTVAIVLRLVSDIDVNAHMATLVSIVLAI